MAQGEHVAKIILAIKCFKTCARKRFSVENCDCYQQVLTEGEVARRTGGIVRLRFKRPVVRSLSLRTLIWGARGVKGKAHGAVSVVPTLAQRTRKNGAPSALVVLAGEASATRPCIHPSVVQVKPLSLLGSFFDVISFVAGGPP